MMTKLKRLNNAYTPALIAIIGLLVLGSVVTRGFLSVNNLSSILMTASILTLVSVGQAAAVLSGDSGLDMSVGAVMSLTALFGPMVASGDDGLAMLAMLVVSVGLGAAVGLLNGIGIQILKIVPLVMTLIMSTVVNGFAVMVTKGQPSVSVPNVLQGISRTLFGPLRILPMIVIVLLLFLEFVLLRRSRFGRSLFLAGCNRRAAELCGINSRAVVVVAYTFSGAVAGLAGLMLVGYAGTAQMSMADSYTMLSIAAVVIGGTKLSGGKGSFVGGALGAGVLTLITTILQALNMAAGLRLLIQGVILISVLMLNSREPKLRQ